MLNESAHFSFFSSSRKARMWEKGLSFLREYTFLASSNSCFSSHHDLFNPVMYATAPTHLLHLACTNGHFDSHAFPVRRYAPSSESFMKSSGTLSKNVILCCAEPDPAESSLILHHAWARTAISLSFQCFAARFCGVGTGDGAGSSVGIVRGDTLDMTAMDRNQVGS